MGQCGTGNEELRLSNGIVEHQLSSCSLSQLTLLITSFKSCRLTILNDILIWGAHARVIGVLEGPEAIFAVSAGLPNCGVLADGDVVRVKHPLFVLKI